MKTYTVPVLTSDGTFKDCPISEPHPLPEATLTVDEALLASPENVLIYDIETDGFNPTQVWCVAIRSMDPEDETVVYADHPDYAPLNEGIARLLNARIIIGHNVYGFDNPVLAKLVNPAFAEMRPFPQMVRQLPEVLDSLALTRSATGDLDVNACAGLTRNDWQFFSANQLEKDLVKSHSLRAWGQRLGFPKGDFDDFSQFSDEMARYCVRDVEVNYEVVRFFGQTKYRAWSNESEFHYWIQRMSNNGIPFDRKAAEDLYVKLVSRRSELNSSLQEEFPPRVEEMKTPAYWLDPETGDKYPTKSAAPDNKTKNRLQRGPNKTKEIPFNPGSRQQAAERLKEKFGWEPEIFTPSGQPEVSESVLSGMPWEAAKQLNEYLMIQKRLGMIGDGDNAWLKLERNGRIHGQVNPCGANGGRCTHFKPNLGQITAPRSPYGKEMRSCFAAPELWEFFGMDLKGIELRMLGHFLAPFDNGEYIKQILEGDIHAYNRDQAALYLPWLGERPDSRDIAKTLIYATIYGGGPTAIGAVVGGGRKIGKSLQDAFFKGIPALPALIEAVKLTYKDRGYLHGIDGRLIYPRSDHSALNTLLQSSAAVVMKYVTSAFNRYVDRQDNFEMVAHVHDEYQCIFKEDTHLFEEGMLYPVTAKTLNLFCVMAAESATEQFNLRIPIEVDTRTGPTWADTH